MVEKIFTNNCSAIHYFDRFQLKLIHMYTATETGRSKSGPFVTDDHFLLLFSL